MAVEKRVLVVSPNQSVARALTAAVRRAGYAAAVATSYAQAKERLSMAPHLLITELKLGEYNGLQLALRALNAEIPAIVLADPAFEHEVEHLGACWSSFDSVDGEELAATMRRLVQGVRGDTEFWGDGEFESQTLRPPTGGAHLH